MIEYPEGAFGFQILFRIHGSAVYKAAFPALLSSIIYLILNHTLGTYLNDFQVLDHPYPMAALIAAFTFLLSFRANFAYNRYWEAFGSVHGMHSKWVDVCTDLAAFHLQAACYDNIKPPSFGANPHLQSLERERERNEPTSEEIAHQIEEADEAQQEKKSRFSRWMLRRRKKKRDRQSSATAGPGGISSPERKIQSARYESRIQNAKKSINAPKSIASKKRGGKRGGKAHRRVVSSLPTFTAKTARDAMDTNPLFLQEATHLLSLLSAVAMSTLRNDPDTVESPLIPFTPGAPFPCVDPDDLTADIRSDWDPPKDFFWFPTIQFLFGWSRNERGRNVYNAARPFRVIGGVSDNEVALLQAARGPQAKVNLVSMWVQEFISREYLAGSTGNVAPPILSRLFQYVSDGCLNYNQARKVAYIPFPFPHAQITCLFVFVILGFIPVLMLAFVDNEALGFFLNLLTTMCFCGLHEVARELESPFKNAPNDLPANNLHAQYNEALMTVFSGYHPDAYWEVKEETVPGSSTVPGESDPMLSLDSSENGEDNEQKAASIDIGELVSGLRGGQSHEGVEIEHNENDEHRGPMLDDSLAMHDPTDQDHHS